MAGEASLAEQTTDGHVEEKKMIDDTKVLEGENVCCDKDVGGTVESGEPKMEQQASSEIASINTEKTVKDEKDVTHVDEEVKKEYGDDKAPASGVMEDKKDDMPVVSDVKEEIDDTKVFSSEVSVNSKDDTCVAENVKVKAETGTISSSEVTEVENSKSEEGEKTKDTAESLSEVVKHLVVAPEISSVQELEQVGQESQVSKPVGGIGKANEESSDITADPALASETVEEKALAAIQLAADATRELEKEDEIHVAEVLEASKDENVLTNDAEIPHEVSKEEHDVKESGITPASQAPDVDAVSENIKEANDCAVGCEEETKNEGSGLKATENLVKELTFDPSLSKTSTIVGEAEPTDSNLVTEAGESAVKPEIKIESQKDVTLENESVEEQKEEKTVESKVAKEHKGEKTLEALLIAEKKEGTNVETDSIEEQKEKKSLETNSTLIAADETGDLSYPADEVTKTCIEEEKNSEGADKVAEEQRDFDASAIRTTENPSEKERVSEVAMLPKGESLMDNTTQVHTSTDKDKEGQKDAVDISIMEPVSRAEETEKSHLADVKIDETEDKKDEAKEIDNQRLVESCNDDASSKNDVEAEKSETPTKPKTLISKLKRSIVKVKKAISGKSPSSKTISAESKDASEVR